MKQPAVDPFQAIGDPSRRHMLQLLCKKSLTINALAENFEMTRPAVSKHVKILHLAGFIVIKDIGRERHCTLHQKGFQQLQEWMHYFDRFWQTRLQKLDQLIQEKSKTK